MSTLLDSRTDERTALGHGPVAHIVAPHGKEGEEGYVDGATLVMMGRVEGLPVTALCGYVWVPTRDPKPLPMCTACQAAYEGRFGHDLERDGETGPVNS